MAFYSKNPGKQFLLIGLNLFLSFQPIMAIFRPHPGTPFRPIFNWAHFIVGTLAYIFASKNIMGLKGWLTYFERQMILPSLYKVYHNTKQNPYLFLEVNWRFSAFSMYPFYRHLHDKSLDRSGRKVDRFSIYFCSYNRGNYSFCD